MISNYQLMMVEEEIGKAEAKHGLLSIDLMDSLSVLAEEFGEVAHCIRDMREGDTTSETRDLLYEELAQVAAVCFRMMQSMEDGAYVKPLVGMS